MKASIISICVFLVLVLGIIGNGVYINYITKDLTEQIAELEPEEYQELNSTYEHWSKHHFYICFSSPHDKTDKIEECFRVMLEKSRNGEDEGFYEYRALLLNYVDEIKRVQALSFDAIV